MAEAKLTWGERTILGVFGLWIGFFATNAFPFITEPILDMVPFNLGGIGLFIIGLFLASILYAYFSSKTERNKPETALKKAFGRTLPRIYGEAFAILTVGIVGGMTIVASLITETAGLSGDILVNFPIFIWGSLITVIGYLNIGGTITVIPDWIVDIITGVTPLQWLGVVMVLGGLFASLKWS